MTRENSGEHAAHRIVAGKMLRCTMISCDGFLFMFEQLSIELISQQIQ